MSVGKMSWYRKAQRLRRRRNKKLKLSWNFYVQAQNEKSKFLQLAFAPKEIVLEETIFGLGMQIANRVLVYCKIKKQLEDRFQVI